MSARAAAPGPAPSSDRTPEVAAASSLQVQVTRDSGRLAALDGAALVAVLFAGCFVLSAVALVIGTHGSGVGDWLHVGGWLAGMTFRGHLTSSADTSLGPLSLGGGFAFALQPGLPFVCAVAFVAWRSWRSETQHRSATTATLAASAAITAASAAAVEAVLAAVLTGSTSFTSGTEQFQSGASLGVSVPSVMLGTFAYVWLAGAAGRLACAWRREGVPARLRALLAPWLAPARQLGEFFAFAAIPVVLLGVVGLVVDGASVGTWMLILLTLPFAVLVGSLFSAGAGLSLGASIGVGSLGNSYGILSGGVPAWTFALLLIPCFAVLMVAARSSRRGVPAEPPWPDALRGAAFACAVFVIVSFITSITGSGNAIGIGGSFRIGLDWGTGIAISLFWGGAVSLSRFFVPRLLGAHRLSAVDSFVTGLVTRPRRPRPAPSAPAPVPAAPVPAAAAAAEPVPAATAASAAVSLIAELPTQSLPAAPRQETRLPDEALAPPAEPVAPPLSPPAEPLAPAGEPLVEEPATEAQQTDELQLRCPKCGHENLTGSRFCGLCGGELVPPARAIADAASRRRSSARWRAVPGPLAPLASRTPSFGSVQRLVPVTLIAFVLIVAGVVIITSGVFSSHRAASPGSRSRAQAARTAATTAKATASSASAANASASASPTTSAQPTTSTTSPRNPSEETYSGQAFSISYPSGWIARDREQSKGSYADTTFVSPTDPNTLLRIDVTPNPAGSDPMTDAQPVISDLQKQSGYQQIDLSSGTFEGFPSVHWEFTVVESGVPLQKEDEIFTDTNNGYSVALLTQAPANQYGALAQNLASLRRTLSMK